VEIFEKSDPCEFDVILMDMMMPVMNGEQATRAIRALAREDAQTIPIIAATANAFAEDVEAAKAAGMNDHLAKPIDIQPLRDMILKYV
jgi:CheY-like chemotaxis protein